VLGVVFRLGVWLVVLLLEFMLSRLILLLRYRYVILCWCSFFLVICRVTRVLRFVVLVVLVVFVLMWRKLGLIFMCMCFILLMWL